MYNKLFTKILDSSIWLEPDATRIVWVTCIAAMDEDGFVQMATVENLAKRANVSLKACQKAVERLESPDKGSSDPDQDGRRLERVQGGWMVLNATKYRELVTREVSKAQTRERVKRFRERKKTPVTTSNGETRNVNDSVTPSEAVSEAVSEARSGSEAAAEKNEPPPQHGTAYKPKTRPLPGFQRLRVFRWMVEELVGVLGDHLESFDLEGWLQSLDQDGSLVIPETWPWLKTMLVAEVARRQLPVAGQAVTFTKAELNHAKEVRRVRMGCRHEPRCATFDTCVLRIAQEIRADV